MSRKPPVAFEILGIARNLLPKYNELGEMMTSGSLSANHHSMADVLIDSLISINGMILLANSKSLSFSTLILGKAQERLD